MKNLFKIRIRSYIVLLIAFIAIFFYACRNEEMVLEKDINASAANDKVPIHKSGKKMGNLIISDSAIFLSQTSLSLINKVTEDKIIFNSKPPQDSIKKGYILSGILITEENVHNILSRVESIVEEKGKVIVKTKPVEIHEFIYSGSLKGEINPSKVTHIKNNKSYIQYMEIEGLPNAVYQKRNSSKGSIAVIKFDKVNFDYNFELPSTENLKSNISLKGEFTPVLDYNIDFGWTGLNDFTLNLLIKDIDLTSHFNSTATIVYKKSFNDYLNIPIAPIFLGPTGLILSPIISGSPYIDITGKGEVNIDLFNIRGNIDFQASFTNPIISNLYFSPPGFENAKGSIKAETGIRLNTDVSLLFTSVQLAGAGFSNKIGAGAQVKIDTTNKLNMNIEGLLESDAHLKIGPYEKYFPLAKWTYTFYNKSFPLN
nr:hypothetical protein [Elizabethkingia sp. ASV34]